MHVSVDKPIITQYLTGYTIPTRKEDAWTALRRISRLNEFVGII